MKGGRKRKDNVELEKTGNYLKITRFGILVCIRKKEDVEIDGDIIHWKDEDGDVVLKRKSGFMTLTTGGSTFNVAKDGSIDYPMPE
jgi:hypothetical protein